MDKKILFMALGTSAVLLAGCSKKLGQFQSDFFTTNPTPLETVGQQVPATISARVPAKFMVKNAKVTATPVLTYNNGAQQVQSTPVLFQGENVRDNGQVVSYANGGSVTIPFNIVYDPAMESSDLYLYFDVDQNGKTYVLDPVKVGYGIIATSTLADAGTVAPAIAPDKFQRVISDTYSADIHFLINQANIRANQLSSTQVVDLNKQLVDANAAPNMEIADIAIHSYASPDGSLEFNTQLAEQREKNTQKYVEGQLAKDKITEFGELTASFTPEDWEGFQTLVEKSNIQDKELILSVLKMYKDPQERERELRNLAAVFDELADQILPQLRYSRIKATINVIGKSDAEMEQLFATNPSALSDDEILFLATLTNDNAKKMAIYKKATELYGNDYRTWNNLAATQFAAGDYSAAQQSLAKAASLAKGNKEIDLNKGLLALVNGDYREANTLIGAAAGLPSAGDALGVYYLTQGEVANAATAFGNSKTNNAALAQLLSKDYSKAKSTLQAVANPDATTYYLLALVGARTNNESMVMDNLRQAVRLNPAYLARAQKDLEFANYSLSSL